MVQPVPSSEPSLSADAPRSSGSPTFPPVPVIPSKAWDDRAALRTEHLLMAALAVGAGMALWALWTPLVLAAWAAVVASPLHDRLMRRARVPGGGRERAAGVVTVCLSLLLLLPFIIAVPFFIDSAISLFQTLRTSSGSRDALRMLVSAEPSGATNGQFSWRELMSLVERYSSGLVSAASTVFGAITEVSVGAFVFVVGFYTFLVDGRRGYAWVVARSPIPKDHLMRFGDAFVETGRGLLMGLGFTSLIQAAIATLGYVVLGVPQALVLGVLTLLASLLPFLGSALVWLPVSIGLFLSGRTGAGVALVAIGAFVGIVDNWIRPVLSNRANLRLPSFVVLVAMLGGTAAFGGSGLLLGPLLVRLFVETLKILHGDPRSIMPVVARRS